MSPETIGHQIAERVKARLKATTHPAECGAYCAALQIVAEVCGIAITTSATPAPEPDRAPLSTHVRTDYAGFQIRQRDDQRWIVVKDGCNAMPGATHFGSESEAMRAVDVLQAVEGDADRFWHLLRAITRPLENDPR